MRPGIGTLIGLQAQVEPPTELLVGAERYKIERKEAEAEAKRKKYKDLRNIWSSDLAGIDIRFHGGIKDIASEIREKAIELKEQGVTNIEGHETIAPLMFQLESAMSSAKLSTTQIITERAGVRAGTFEGKEKGVIDYDSADFERWNKEYTVRPFVYKAGSIGRVMFDEMKEVYKPMQTTLKDWVFAKLPEFEDVEAGYEIFSKQLITSQAKIESETELYYDTSPLYQTRVNERYAELPPEEKRRIEEKEGVINPALEYETEKNLKRFTKDMKEYYIKSRYKGISAAPEAEFVEPGKELKEIKVYDQILGETVVLSSAYTQKGSKAFSTSNVINKEVTISVSANAVSVEEGKAVHAGAAYLTSPEFRPTLKSNDYIVLSRPGAVYPKGSYIFKKEDVKEAREKGYDTEYVKGVYYDSYSQNVIGADENKAVPKNRIRTFVEFDDVSMDIKTIDRDNFDLYDKGLTEATNKLNKGYVVKIKVSKAEEKGRISKEAKPIIDLIKPIKAKKEEDRTDQDKINLEKYEKEIKELVNELKVLTGKEPLPEGKTIWDIGIEGIKKLFEEEVKPEEETEYKKLKEKYGIKSK